MNTQVSNSQSPEREAQSLSLMQESEPMLGRTFTVATRVTIYVLVFVTVSLITSPVLSLPLSLWLIVLLALSHKRDMAFSFLVFYLVLFAIYTVMFIAHIHLFIFSPPKILSFIGVMPTMLALFFIVTAPPGLLSAALARMRMPKKIIVGMLVIVRFFPTIASFWVKYRDAVRTRGLLSFSSVVRNPLVGLEYVVVPLLLSLATSADQLSTSAIARAAEAPTRRTSYYFQKMNSSDIVAILITLAVCTGCVVLSRIG